MPLAATSIDPLAHFLDAIFRREHRKPVPLQTTHFDVTIRGGLAFVTTQRTFRNAEKKSIEAVMTFPVPVDATLCALTASIDGRVLHAVARARDKASKVYEAALTAGKSAILHQELLKGIHMVSVGHVRPGGEIVVTDTWTAPLSFLDAAPRLRIPTTVGEIYGQSPVAPPDDLVTGGTVHEATISIACIDGTATLLQGGTPIDGRYRITLDAPIDIVVAGWQPRKLTGVAADGRQVVLDIAPTPAADAQLDIDVLFDRSGSMGDDATSYSELNATKFDLATAGLVAAVHHHLRPADRMRLWQFDDHVDDLGEAIGANCGALVERIDDPRGGTEIGRAFDAVLAAPNKSGKARNVVIVTDGLSWAFDPQRLARAGMQVTAVLIGEDASEAAIGHLAGLTGGQVFCAIGSDAGGAIAAALDAARMPQRQPETLPDKPQCADVLRRGARVTATWGAKGEGHASAVARQIGATAAMLAIPNMREDAAAKLAEAEGVVCAYTSLVLVDESGERHEGLPARRKVELAAVRRVGRLSAMRVPYVEDLAPRPLGSRRLSAKYADERAPAEARRMAAETDRLAGPPRASAVTVHRSWPPHGAEAANASISIFNVSRLVGRIDWDADPDALRHGDLTGLPPDVSAAIAYATQMPEITALARKLGIEPAAVVIGLMARAAGGHSRSATRLADALLGRTPAKELDAAAAAVGL